jgi:hypothetical protein
MSQLKTDDLGWHLDLTPDQLDHFYAELLRTEQSRNGGISGRLLDDLETQEVK